MSIGLGDKTITNLAYGDKNISQVMLGDKLVWDNNSYRAWTPLVFQDVVTWESDLTTHENYAFYMTGNRGYNGDNEERGSNEFFKWEIKNGNTFRIECIKDMPKSSGKDAHSCWFEILRTNNTDQVVFNNAIKGSFWKVSFTLRGYGLGFKNRGVTNGTILKIGNNSINFYNNDNSDSNYKPSIDGITNSSFNEEFNLVFFGGGGISLNFLYNFENDVIAKKGEYLELSDFKFKQSKTPLPLINDEFGAYNLGNYIPNTKYTSFDRPSTYFLDDKYNVDNKYSPKGELYKTIRNTEENTIRFEVIKTNNGESYYGFINESIYFNASYLDEQGNKVSYKNDVGKMCSIIEPYHSYHIHGYVKGTPNAKLDLMVDYDKALFKNYRIEFNESEYTYFDINLGRWATAYFNIGGLKDCFRLGYYTNSNLQTTKGDFIELKDLVIERID